MNIEHVALNVTDPAGMAEWYGRHLHMQVVRRIGGPAQAHFISDQAGRVVLELYRHPQVAVPDYAAMDPMVLHVAFVVADVAGERQRLLAGGAKAEGEVTTTDAGDQLAMLRDPWGLPVQLVKRGKPLMPAE